MVYLKKAVSERAHQRFRRQFQSVISQQILNNLLRCNVWWFPRLVHSLNKSRPNSPIYMERPTRAQLYQGDKTDVHSGKLVSYNQSLLPVAESTVILSCPNSVRQAHYKIRFDTRNNRKLPGRGVKMAARHGDPGATQQCGRCEF